MSDPSHVIIIIIINVRGDKTDMERRKSCSTSGVCLPSVEGSGEELEEAMDNCIWARVEIVFDTNASATMGMKKCSKVLVCIAIWQKSVIRETIQRGRVFLVMDARHTTCMKKKHF